MWEFIRNLFNFNQASSVATVQSAGILGKKAKIQSILNVFETGSIKGDYANVTIYADGPGNRRQITYGRSQTTEWGNLQALIKKYVDAKGKYADFFKPYLSKIGKVTLVNDSAFITKLKEAGKEAIMQKTQDDFFDEHYWAPAYKFMQDNGFVTPLAGLVIYDSYIHSGSIPSFLRTRFPASPPAKGGNEKQWIEQYLNARHSWLANHSRTILRKTTYRTKNMRTAVMEGNWNLEKEFNANGIKVA